MKKNNTKPLIPVFEFNIFVLPYRLWEMVEKGERGELSRPEMLALLHAAKSPEPEEHSDEVLKEICRQIAEKLVQYGVNLQAATLAHLGMGAPRPREYATLLLCGRYSCRPEQLLNVSLAEVFGHLGCIDAEQQVEIFAQQQQDEAEFS